MSGMGVVRNGEHEGGVLSVNVSGMVSAMSVNRVRNGVRGHSGHPPTHSRCVVSGMLPSGLGLCRVCLEPCRPDSRYCSGACLQVERDCWWALMREKGENRAKRWARSSLGLDEPRVSHAV